MIRIRKIQDDTAPANIKAIAAAQDILRGQFPNIDSADIDKLPEQMRDPVSYGFVSRLFVAENARDTLCGLALMLYFSDIGVCYLELISTALGGTGRGIGDALYNRVRDEALTLGADVLFFECLPDDPALSPDPKIRSQNEARLRFYERFGARPVIGTAYETPVNVEWTDPPYLVVDMLGGSGAPGRDIVRRAVRVVLERKYKNVCTPAYVEMVVESIVDDPVKLRDFRYVRPSKIKSPAAQKGHPLIPVVVNDKHDIHHMHDRGYVEAPARVRVIWQELENAGIAERIDPKHYPDRHILEVHDARLVSYIRRACQLAGKEKSIYPYVFPVRNATRLPKEQTVLAGYYCIDTFTPLNENAWLAARRAVDCTMTAADKVLQGAPAAYALVRPPGHHAESKVFGGFCYLCNAAIAANYLSRYGRVTILDIDYHHGNGQQDIFYQRSDVLTVSIHGDPSVAYPYFTGFSDEKGLEEGAGFNVNIPLPESITPEDYRRALTDALRRIRQFEPAYLVVSAGFDTAKGDPTGTWSNLAKDFADIGRAIGSEGYPTLVVQEGGYRVRTLGTNVRSFFVGLIKGQDAARMPTAHVAIEGAGQLANNAKLRWRDAIRLEDAERIRSLVATTGTFSPYQIEAFSDAVELRVTNGASAGYDFVLADRDGRVIGCACFGRAGGTEGSFNLHWIAVEPEAQNGGLGRMLLGKAEIVMRGMGGVSVYADASSTEQHKVFRSFLVSMEFHEQTRLEDYYRKGEARVIFEKLLG